MYCKHDLVNHASHAKKADVGVAIYCSACFNVHTENPQVFCWVGNDQHVMILGMFNRSFDMVRHTNAMFRMEFGSLLTRLLPATHSYNSLQSNKLLRCQKYLIYNTENKTKNFSVKIKFNTCFSNSNFLYCIITDPWAY